MIQFSPRFVLRAAMLPGWLLLSWAASAPAQQFAITAADVDAEASCALVNGQRQPVTAEKLQHVLGLLPASADVQWTTGNARTDPQESVYQFLVAFRRPVTFGSLFVFSSAGEIRCLNADAAWPARPDNLAAWTALDAPPAQAAARLVVLPSAVTTQAILLTQRRSWPAATVDAVRLFRQRWQNITPGGLAYASREYYREPADFTPPKLFAASLVSTGTGAWQNVGKGRDGRIAAPPVSDVSPEWFMLAWPKRHTLAGLWLHSTASNFTLEYYDGPEAINPRAGLPHEWKKIRNIAENKSHGRWLMFPEPIATRGLRIHVTKVEGRAPQVAEIDGLQAFEDLADRPVQLLGRASSQDAAPPFEVPLALADDGNLTLAVNDASGRRVRNVLARRPLKAGSVLAPWDLRDEQGTLVAPGEYQWSAISCPTLQTRYEFTVYPNVTENAPENAGWFTGMSGSGGWLADHCANSAVCAVDQRIFLGAVMAESGVALIECDLAGHKRWGHSGFAAWTGVGHLASDGKTLFNATQILGTVNDTVWGVDLETKRVRDVLTMPPTAKRKRGLKGIAARQGELLLSVQAPQDWLAGTAAVDDVDLANCYPLYPPARQPRYAHEPVPEPRTDFLRLLRLTETPPGTSAPGSLIYLKSMADAAARQHIVVAFNRPVPLGSVVLPRPDRKDVRVRLSMLKADAPFPPDMNDPRQWLDFPIQPRGDWDVVAAPEGATSRALRLTFIKGEIAASDDLLAGPDSPQPAKDDSLASKSSAAQAALGSFGANAERWQAQLEGLKLLRRRFQNLSSSAEVLTSSGRVGPDGSWDAVRSEPITPENPAIYAQQWKSPQKVRGLAIKEIDGRLTKVDVYTGPLDRPLQLAGSADWQEVAQYEQPRRYYYQPDRKNNADARYLDGYVDFGREIETRAIRLRVVEQWSDQGDRNLYGVRVDRGARDLNPARCRIYGVAAVQYLGGESPIDPLTDERIEVFDSASGKLKQEIPLANPGRIAWNHLGELLAVSNQAVVKLDVATGKHETLIADLQAPGDLAIDRQGRIYVVDRAPERENIRVYSPAGKHLRSIGKAGPRQAGTWEPDRLSRVVDIEIDAQDQLWVVEETYWPKRVTLWSTDGTFKREFLGNTPYGGGGVLDSLDKRRLFCGPLEFELDWQTGHSRLKNLTWTGATPPGEVPIRAEGRTYVVSRTSFGAQCGIVYLYEQDHLKLAAAVGQAGAFQPLHSAEMVARLGGPALDTKKFIWADLNGNGAVDPEEVTLSPKPAQMANVGNFDHYLSVQAGPLRYRVKAYAVGGAPVFEEEHIAGVPPHYVTKLDGGGYHVFGTDGKPETGLAADGSVRWTYPSVGAGGHALYKAATWAADQVVSQFEVIGHETAAGPLGEFLVMHTNAGDWNVWTNDGLLVGPVFRDYRDPQARPWSMQQHERGMILENMTLGQEHFQGYFCRSQADGKFYAVAGHNHVSVVEVLGLDKVRRYSGRIVVTADDIKRAQAWQEQHEQVAVYERTPVIDCYRLDKPPALDGKLDDWPAANASIGQAARLHIGFDDTHLYVAYDTDRTGPLKNTGEQWDRLFKTGAAVDLQLSVDPEAAVDRRGPATGDLRLLLTYMGERPVAVLYRPVAAGGAKGEPWRVVSPVGEAVFDEVRQVERVRMARSPDKPQGGYTVEAAIPLADLGLKPADGLRIKLDWGLLRTGPDGHEVVERLYWANKATAILADAPSEARLHPDLWGFALFHDNHRPTAEDRFDTNFAGTEKKTKPQARDLDDLLDGVKIDGKK